jgi:hypothetical protein
MVTIFITNYWLLRVMRIPYLETQSGSAMMLNGASYRHRTNNYDVLSERIAKIFVRRKLPRSGDVSDRATPNAIRVFRRLFGSSEEVTFFEGWPTGFEPATAGTTIRGSTVELRPPCKRGKGT